MEKLIWTTEKRMVKELIPYEHNPRKMSPEQKRALENSLTQFGLVEIPAINLDNKLIAGHQRCKAMMLLGMENQYIDVRVPNRLLSEKELKEYNIASNAIKGDWLEEILKEHFTEVNLEDFGIQFEEIDALISENAKTSEEKPTYPIVAELSEKYEAFVIVSTNEIDSNFIKQVLQLSQERSYKSDAVGQTHVITAKKFSDLWKSK